MVALVRPCLPLTDLTQQMSAPVAGRRYVWLFSDPAATDRSYPHPKNVCACGWQTKWVAFLRPCVFKNVCACGCLGVWVAGRVCGWVCIGVLSEEAGWLASKQAGWLSGSWVVLFPKAAANCLSDESERPLSEGQAKLQQQLPATSACSCNITQFIHYLSILREIMLCAPW